VEQPEGLHHKPLVLKEQVAVRGDVQGDASPRLLLRMQGVGVCGHLRKQKTRLRKPSADGMLVCSRAEQYIEIPSQSQYGQVQYPNHRNCNFLMRMKCANENV